MSVIQQDPSEVCDLVLGYLKKSNLNFSLMESPFSVSITIKKSFIKNKNGTVRAPVFPPPTIFVGGSDVVNLLDENKILRQTIDDLEASSKAASRAHNEKIPELTENQSATTLNENPIKDNNHNMIHVTSSSITLVPKMSNPILLSSKTISNVIPSKANPILDLSNGIDNFTLVPIKTNTTMVSSMVHANSGQPCKKFNSTPVTTTISNYVMNQQTQSSPILVSNKANPKLVSNQTLPNIISSQTNLFPVPCRTKSKTELSSPPNPEIRSSGSSSTPRTPPGYPSPCRAQSVLGLTAEYLDMNDEEFRNFYKVMNKQPDESSDYTDSDESSESDIDDKETDEEIELSEETNMN